ncbi:hypothetical protein B0H19DRAFT_1169842 [Mycena capillaripes]|nr:hypothetical protein B0H19DRAFT_1169842 [Mycena capillaripes]
METDQSFRDRLAAIDAQIALLQAERKIIQKRLGSLTYPVLSLPFDVTAEIFVHCLPDVQHSEPILHFSRHTPPTALLLSQICRAWRYVAFKTPKIWATFRISVADWSKDYVRSSRRFTEWMERAGSSPLSFIIHQKERYPPNKAAKILPSILDLSIQWRHVDLRLSFKDLTRENFQSGLRGRLPSLQTLRIQSYGRPTTITAFEHAPNLRSVVLEGLPPTMLLLPWKQLTHFKGESLDGMHCLHVLRLAVSLVECNFHRVEQDMTETALLPPHLALKVLHLTGQLACLDILCILTLPALLELELDDGDGVGIESHQEFSSFLSRSRPPLHRLTLHRYQPLIHSFSLLPHLTILEMQDLSVDEMSSLLRDLQVRDSVAFLPNLRYLVVSVHMYSNHTAEPSAIRYGELADALEYRWKNSSITAPRIESFRMTWAPAGVYGEHRHNKLHLIPSPDFRINLPRLLELVDEGMHISVIAEVRTSPPLTQAWI